MKTFSQLWQELESEVSSFSGVGTLKRMVGGRNECPMFLGVMQPSLKRTFVLQVPKDSVLAPESLPASKGFDFSFKILGDEVNPESVSFIITVIDRSFDQIFESIVEDLYSNLHDIEKPKEVVSTFYRRVRLWQKFFEKQSTNGLSIEAQKGLYGELYFLNNQVLKKGPYHWYLNCWTGSEARQHDFQFGNLSVEVKTTSSKQHQKLHIASEQQLDETLIDKLYLFYVSVSLVQNNDNTLPALIKDVRKKLLGEPSALEMFNSSLISRGYSDMHEPVYAEQGYKVRETSFFLIGEGFPRIREGDLKKGVGDVQYTISVDMCRKYSCGESCFYSDLIEVSK